MPMLFVASAVLALSAMLLPFAFMLLGLARSA